MYTQCPHCHTLFRISAGQLKAAAGKAHCCRCDQVFSALDNLREPQQDEAWPESRLIDDLPEQQNLELAFDQPDPDSRPEEAERGLSDLLQSLRFDSAPVPDTGNQEIHTSTLATDDERDPFEPIYDLSDTGIDSVQIGLDSQLYGPLPDSPSGTPGKLPGGSPETTQQADRESLDSNTEPGGQTQENETTGHSDLPPPFPIPDDLPTLEPTVHQPLALEEELQAVDNKGKSIVGWSLAILLLLLLAIGQLAWFGRDHLIRYPAGRTLLENACELLPCRLPPRRSPQDIQVVSRSISSHPQRDNALLVMLTLRNQAPFEQAYPTLELSLLDTRGSVIARRSFDPEKYRGSDPALLQPGVPVSVRLELEDPGQEVVGFRFDFY